MYARAMSSLKRKRDSVQHETDEEVLESEKERQFDSNQDKPRKQKEACQVFLPKYHEKYPVLVTSRKSKFHAHCVLCKSDVSVKASGIYDCKRHIESASHKSFEANATPTSKQQKLDCFVLRPGTAKGSAKDEFIRDVTRAEATICQIIADANLPLATADKLSAAVKFAFPDSKIAAGKISLNFH